LQALAIAQSCQFYQTRFRNGYRVSLLINTANKTYHYSDKLVNDKFGRQAARLAQWGGKNSTFIQKSNMSPI